MLRFISQFLRVREKRRAQVRAERAERESQRDRAAEIVAAEEHAAFQKKLAHLPQEIRTEETLAERITLEDDRGHPVELRFGDLMKALNAKAITVELETDNRTFPELKTRLFLEVKGTNGVIRGDVIFSSDSKQWTEGPPKRTNVLSHRAFKPFYDKQCE